MKPVCIALLAGIAACAFAQPGSATQSGTYKERELYSFFGSYGEFPDAGLLDVKGILYGTTVHGGNVSDDGVAFSLDPRTGAVSVIHTFCSEESCTDGAWPEAGLVNVSGTLYGTTSIGGSADEGTVFSLDPATGAETVIHSFCSRGNCADGRYPVAGLISVNGRLYGTTHRGGGGSCGNAGCGIVFSLDPNTGTETVLYAFNGADGADPKAGLVSGAGLLYGTTYAGGRDHDGTVFSVDPSTGAEAVVYSFCTGRRRCPDGGERPKAGLIDVHGKLYGTTSSGGADGDGTVFELKEKRR